MKRHGFCSQTNGWSFLGHLNFQPFRNLHHMGLGIFMSYLGSLYGWGLRVDLGAGVAESCPAVPHCQTFQRRRVMTFNFGLMWEWGRLWITSKFLPWPWLLKASACAKLLSRSTYFINKGLYRITQDKESITHSRDCCKVTCPLLLLPLIFEGVGGEGKL